MSEVYNLRAALEIIGCIIRDGEAPNDALTIIEEVLDKPREAFTGTATDADDRQREREQ